MTIRNKNKFFYLSILFHGVIVVGLVFLSKERQKNTDSTQKITWIDIEPTKKNDKKNQIVSSLEGQKTEEAPKDAFLGKENRKVTEQFSALSESRSAPEQKQQSKKVKNQKSGTTEKVQLSKLGVSLPTAPSRKEEVADYLNWSQFSDSFGKVNADYIKGLKEGEQSALNTREFMYYSYFERIKSQLNIAWNMLIKEQVAKVYRSGRSIAESKDLITKTIVTLNNKGEVERVQLVEESGVSDLDEAALRAFNKAGPFLNPPKGIVDNSGKIEISWDFIIRT